MQLWLGAGLLLGCATLPEYAAPKGGVVDAGKLDSSDVIGYRQLTRADFRGTQAPPEFAPVAARLGPGKCVQVRTSAHLVVELDAPSFRVLLLPQNAPELGNVLWEWVTSVGVSYVF